MPTYQYACTNPACGSPFELVQSFTDPAASECPVCGGPVRKVFSAVGVVFKGSGFYRTDSREAANGKSGGGSSSPGKDAKESKESSKTSESTSTASTASPGSSGSGSSSSSSSTAGTSSGTSSTSGRSASASGKAAASS